MLKLPSLFVAFCGLASAAVVPSLDQRSNIANVATRHSQSGVTTLSSSQLNALTPYAEFARAAYCPSSALQGWACGGSSSFCSI